MLDLQAKIMVEPVEVPTLNFHGEQDGCILTNSLEGMESSFPKELRKVIQSRTQLYRQNLPTQISKPVKSIKGWIL